MSRLPYTKLAPGGYSALASLGHYISTGTALEPVLLELVYLRASQLNGCGFCIGMHTEELHKHHEPDSRIDAVADWRGSDAFTPRERAALAWAEAVTDVNASHVSDEEFAAVKEFFADKDLVDLTFAIANINAWNRLGVAFRAEWKPKGQMREAEMRGAERRDTERRETERRETEMRETERRETEMRETEMREAVGREAAGQGAEMGTVAE